MVLQVHGPLFSSERICSNRSETPVSLPIGVPKKNANADKVSGEEHFYLFASTIAPGRWVKQEYSISADRSIAECV